MSGLVSIVIPVRNEHENIGPCLDGLERGLPGVDIEILICHDSDDDTTLAAIEALPRKPLALRYVKNTLGPGPSCAMRAGFHAARGDAIVVTMADLSDPPPAIAVMAQKIRGGADIVSGSRYMAGGRQIGGPPVKTLLSRMTGLSLYYLAGVGTHDATTSFRGFSPRLLREVELESQTGFTLGLEATVKAHLGGYAVDEVPVTWTDRTAGQSNFRVAKWLGAYLRFYFLAMRWPLVVWALWSALGLASLFGAVRAPIVLFAPVASLVVIVAARRARGRMSPLDALIPLGWSSFVFAAGRAQAPLGFIIAAIASAACLGVASTARKRRRVAAPSTP
jgi:glycosyltransferase involved in cell wall biosynthesis